MTPRVLVFGTFDLLHPGHEFLLHAAAQRGELFVVVARDSNVERIKGRAAVHSQEERMQSVQRIVPNANVLLGGDGHNFLEPVTMVQPDLILLGYDQHLPPGVSMEDLPCPVERLPAFQPETYKTTLLRGEQ